MANSLKPHYGKQGFLNNYNREPRASVLKWQWERLTKDKPEEAPYVPQIVKTDVNALQQASGDRLTWIGHSSALLQLDGVRVLMDPVFSERVSPFSFIGPKRQGELPFQLQDLPPIDVVIISHNHYDHLDLATLKSLEKRDPGKTLFLVGLGNKKLLEDEGIRNVKELDWWDNFFVKGLTLTFTPTQHWSNRGLFDSNQTLWGSWFITTEKFKFFFAGDTGYSKDFQDIYRKFGAVDVALLPIGSYEPRWFMKQNHVDPAEAVQMHKDLHAKLSIAIHWGSFRLSDEAIDAPPALLNEELKKANVLDSSFRVLKRGEILNLEQM
ncbi:MBL fold metallo-hydrolase [Bdellovibrio sp. NC01]|uniref:MBL fold metallo-hydrolase n=1 Tax=Bdellovibrio sp. NC01 TaxID=2220073 RepID=UPI00115C0529|nr:MBL fold metallo-hydrolase [Bdellovibrio sp. NC01]QDK38719.1 MBL fold metallo-hydrolase [Bdellovibrio sp. NC01]